MVERAERVTAAPAAESPCRVLLVDPAELFRAGLEAALGAVSIELVGSTGDLGDAHALLERREPSVVVVDLATGHRPEAPLALITAAAAAGAAVIATSAESTAASVLDSLAAGASGFLTKDRPAQAWIGAIAAAGRGEPALSRTLTHLVLAELRRQRTSVGRAEPANRLSRREWEVLQHIAEGKTNKAVAAALYISPQTVRTHVEHILAKLEVPNRSAAAARFRELAAGRMETVA
jgi:DNA-binding NarL/FixJ family response regulator